MTKEEAEEEVAQARVDFNDVLEQTGGDYEAAVDFMADTFGLEPDYLEELI